MLVNFLRYKKNNPLACRVLVYVVLFSSCVTLAATAWQLYANFRKDVEYIGRRVSQIRAGYGRGLTLGVWDLDQHHIYTLLGGIIELPDIQFLEIRNTAGETIASMGAPREQGIMRREYPLTFIDSRGTPHPLGDLVITASLENVYQRLHESVFQILISQTIKTFLVSGFILLVIRHFITRHLSTIAQYVSQEKLGYLETPINLNRPDSFKRDEMDLVMSAINRMRENLLQYISERDQKEAALKNARNYIDGIINAMPSVLAGVDSTGRVTQWNHGAEILTRVSGSEAVGCPVTALFQDQGPELTALLGATRVSKPLTKNNIPLFKDGDSPLFYDITLYPLAFEGIEGTVIRMDNVTERVRLEEMMIHNEKMVSVGMLAAGVAHEINNPTNGVINLAQILMNDTDPESPEHDIARRITGEGERIARIVHSLLSFSRNAREEKRAACVREILTETLALTKAQIRKEGTCLSQAIPEHLPLISANPQQIQQVFLNVISNAQFALNKKHPGFHRDKVLEINCETVEHRGRCFVRTTFMDRGTGMPEKITKRITDPFFTTKPPGIGTGLGLSISHGIVENHGGFLHIESREHQYTRVTIDLPVKG